MSDITLRSQAMTNQSQQFYDSQRQESGQQMVNTLGQSAQMFVQRQQHAEQQQNIQRELAMREAESGMKMALFQQEQQQNAMKLQMMAAMDQADMGREQVRGAKLQNDLLKAQVDRQNKQTEQSAQQMVLDTRKSLFGDPRDAYEMGMVPDEKELLGYRKPKEGSTELEDFGKRVSERKRATASGEVTDFNRKRNYYQQMYRMAEDAGDMEEMSRWRDKAEELDTGIGGSSGGQSKPKATPPQNKKEVEAIGARIAGRMPPEQKNELAARMLKARGVVLQVMRQAQPDATEQDAMERMLGDLNEASDATAGRRAKLLQLLQGLQ